ncbi:FMN-binding negative transcriptional regulator [Asticcacaulis solisilvae]|uniref:FMN-binding negative transcriptional regulator n=1 Tax=Asticcacaulis solisilvae TaxID=1217274 RepID=UPI003FD75240
MYVPAPYQENRRDVLVPAIAARAFGTLISTGADGIQISHAPFVVGSGGDSLELLCHLARANPQLRDIGEGAEVVATFLVDDAYISPGWYPSKQETGRAVPTWNYIAVEARGRAECIDAPDELLRLVETLTARHEAGRETPWSTADAPESYVEALLRGIVGVHIRVHGLTGAWKLDQKRPDADRQGAAKGLRDIDNRPEMARRMSQA